MDVDPLSDGHGHAPEQDVVALPLPGLDEELIGGHHHPGRVEDGDPVRRRNVGLRGRIWGEESRVDRLGEIVGQVPSEPVRGCDEGLERRTPDAIRVPDTSPEPCRDSNCREIVYPSLPTRPRPDRKRAAGEVPTGGDEHEGNPGCRSKDRAQLGDEGHVEVPEPASDLRRRRPEDGAPR